MHPLHRGEAIGSHWKLVLAGMGKQLGDVPMRDDATCAALLSGSHPVGYAGPVQPNDLRYGRWASESSDYGGGGFHSKHVAHIATIGKGAVAKSATHESRGKRYGRPMLHEWVQAALDHGDISQAELGRRLTAQLGRQIDRAAANKIAKGTRALAADEMLAIAEMTGYPIPVEDAAGIKKVPLVSWVSAGRMEPSSGIMPGEIEDWIAAADLPPGDWIALSVKGDSMNRVAADGATIFVNRSDMDLVDGRFYVFAYDDGDGSTFKRYYSEPERLEPYSTSPDHRPIYLDTPAKVVGRVRMALTMME